ncbi:uncharacterized protein TRIADDRAFT_57273 [Trichoplax adhaerens]|uniref:Rab-GAP TBC domain-containing protein n=1 Tax=Trichoplax adhaerens TaxID=10228 RepID=B3RYZ7_TRIAD|nr:hypothetical protein TRIADDRAFT_57273 [Trichoplax adhaerens]EDV23756.1 hypothetical protein TRIADDRAFT_57273 [Trichoplax adhaerens]|eukprot:XP_002113282.1 hypothetical protein TRIADDRAFT_57273 [Trichoplax adhaerens]
MHSINLIECIENCLIHGLKKRAGGWLRNLSSHALLVKLSKNSQLAANLLEKSYMEDGGFRGRSDSSLSQSRRKISEKQKSVSHIHPALAKHRWILIALMERKLIPIIEELMRVSSKFYESEALMLHTVDGPLLVNLIVGVCALEFTRMKTPDNVWSDPSAEELVKRDRIHSTESFSRMNSQTKPTLGKMNSAISVDDIRSKYSARDHVESMHQNGSATLLYGKNNVLAQPKDGMEPVAGYLSLHKTDLHLLLKWTPNQLMNAGEKYNENILWEYAMTIDFSQIIYLHVHQSNNKNSVILVGFDGVQYKPFIFPKGGAMLSFLSCLESGILPYGKFDPPLFTKKRGGLRSKRSSKFAAKNKDRINSDDYSGLLKELSSDKGSDGLMNFVFRIITTNETKKTKLSRRRAAAKLLREKHAEEVKDVPAEPFANMYSTSEHNLQASSDKQSIKSLCDSMRVQLLSRAFYGWLAYCRHLSTVRIHLSGLVHEKNISITQTSNTSAGITEKVWKELNSSGKVKDEEEIMKLTYFGGVEHSIRKEVWPYLLGHYKVGLTEDEREMIDKASEKSFRRILDEWQACETYLLGKEKGKDDIFMDQDNDSSSLEYKEINGTNDLNQEIDEADARSLSKFDPYSDCYSSISIDTLDRSEIDSAFGSVDNKSNGMSSSESRDNATISKGDSFKKKVKLLRKGSSSFERVSVSSNGSFNSEVLEIFSSNLHRIDKDVMRCDRNYWYFTPNNQHNNLQKLRNIMCSFVWEHLDIGYVQGMCDLAAPLLVIFDDEPKSYSCFCFLMNRMASNFPHGGGMDTHFANMRSLIQILDSEMFDLMHQNGDYTHFYFCYRWFLLDFKRELVYDDVFSVWECIWAARYCVSEHFVLFIALALVENYRYIILDNNMDFTDIIKFFNEMAERHNMNAVLNEARTLVAKVQNLIDTKY